MNIVETVRDDRQHRFDIHLDCEPDPEEGHRCCRRVSLDVVPSYVNVPEFRELQEEVLALQQAVVDKEAMIHGLRQELSNRGHRIIEITKIEHVPVETIVEKVIQVPVIREKIKYVPVSYGFGSEASLASILSSGQGLTKTDKTRELEQRIFEELMPGSLKDLQDRIKELEAQLQMYPGMIQQRDQRIK
jgi:hypothetical protein